jgi:hypothetical protein
MAYIERIAMFCPSDPNHLFDATRAFAAASPARPTSADPQTYRQHVMEGHTEGNKGAGPVHVHGGEVVEQGCPTTAVTRRSRSPAYQVNSQK